MHFPIFFCFLRPLRSSLTNAFFFSNEDEQWLGLYCHEAQACQMSLSNSQNQVQKWSPSRANYSRGCSKSPIRCSSALAGVSFNSLVRLTERNKCHGRLPLVDAIMSTCLVSKYSAYWPIDGLNTNHVHITIGRLNPYEITPPQAIRTMPTSRELPTRTPKSLHWCAPLVPCVDIFSFDIFNVFRLELPEGGILCIFLEPARTALASI